MAQAGISADNSRDERIGQVVNDYLDRVAAGCAEPLDDLLAAHPDLADDLRRDLATAGRLETGRDRIEGLIRRRLLDGSDDLRYVARLGLYGITEFLGSGGMGIVLKAHEEKLDRAVALKIVRPGLADDKNAVERFEREARSAAALKHPNIVTVYGVGRHHDTHYIAMEYVNGPTLADVIREQGPLPNETCRNIFWQLMAALGAAHGAGLIHRDVKSANILLECGNRNAECGTTECGMANADCGISKLGMRNSQRGMSNADDDPLGTATVRERPDSAFFDPNSALAVKDSAFRNPHSAFPADSAIRNPQSAIVKLADFGLARMVSSQTRLTSGDATPGTPEYMSPEQARSDDDIDHRSDLYSAGVVLYEMLTGQIPFRADTPAATVHRILHEDPPDPRRLNKSADPVLSTLALRLMAKKPESRIQSTEATLSELESSRWVLPHWATTRRFRRLAISILLAAVAIMFAVSITPIITKPPRITDVYVDPTNRRRVLVTLEGDVSPQLFFHLRDKSASVKAAVLASTEGGQCVVIGTSNPGGDGYLYGLDPEGVERWRRRLRSDLRWPDCDPPARFEYRALIAVDVDGQAGEEVISAASDCYQYPSVISIVNPATGEVRGSAWHFGQIDQLLIWPNWKGAGRPGVVLRGINNKLDGFDEPLAADARAWGRYDWVSVVAILDPATLLSESRESSTEVLLAVPPTQRVNLPSVSPAAYAFLDLPPGVTTNDVSASRAAARAPEATEVAVIHSMRLDSCPGACETAQGEECLVLGVHRTSLGAIGGINMFAGTDLELCEIYHAPDGWDLNWHVIVQSGEWLAAPTSAADVQSRSTRGLHGHSPTPSQSEDSPD